MTNLYEVAYKSTAKSRITRTAIRCGTNADDESLRHDDVVVISVRCIGEYAGPWCLLNRKEII